MLGALAQLSLVVAAEKSKVPFYICGGLLAVWALVVSIGIGLRRPRFPSNLLGQRVVIAITTALVAGAVTTAVITSGSPVKTGEETATASKPESSPSGGPGGAAAPSTGAQTAPKATTGTPAPPSSPARTSPPHVVHLSSPASGAVAYDTKQLSAQAGTVTVTFANPSPLEHNVTIAQVHKVLGATPTFTNSTRSVTLNLKPGTYSFYCSVPGHRQAGMEGTLKIT